MRISVRGSDGFVLLESLLSMVVILVLVGVMTGVCSFFVMKSGKEFMSVSNLINDFNRRCEVEIE
ncbi:hypothetical protein [Treponema sp.]|uniref:hypothetical protein n=1 Tax=Treponema sp. TaxID=166 RepID=UPI00298DB379|nr:hypothetical protein [Treponema sp.]MCR5614008.1 hypothetical protein [Treponema sp.]